VSALPLPEHDLGEGILALSEVPLQGRLLRVTEVFGVIPRVARAIFLLGFLAHDIAKLWRRWRGAR
jgi:hypothetical protein